MIAQIWDHKFEVDWIDTAYTSDGRWSDAWSCFILLESVFSTRNYVVADGQWLLICQLHIHLDVSPALNVDEPADTVSFPKFEDDIYSLNPWLKDFMRDTSASAKRNEWVPKGIRRLARSFTGYVIA